MLSPVIFSVCARLAQNANAIDAGSVGSTPADLSQRRFTETVNGQPKSVEAYGYTSFTTTFNSTPTDSNQQAPAFVQGDSGGGVFEQAIGVWSLVGLMIEDSGPPAMAGFNFSTGVYTSTQAGMSEQSVMIDLAPYASQIATAIAPEPSGWFWAGWGPSPCSAPGGNARRQRQALSASV